VEAFTELGLYQYSNLAIAKDRSELRN